MIKFSNDKTREKLECQLINSCNHLLPKCWSQHLIHTFLYNISFSHALKLRYSIIDKNEIGLF